MYKLLVFNLIVLNVFIMLASNAYAQKATTKRKKVFLFAGQSNMEGRANAALLSPKDLERLSRAGKRVQLHYNRQPVTPLQLTTPAKYIQRKFTLEQSFGPELFFGILLSEAYQNDEFVFIKRSQGGTSLYGCWNPHWDANTATVMDEANEPRLFSDFVDYGQGILGELDASEYEVCGMLWVQGEADSSSKRGPAPARAYGENLRNLIKESRKAFGTEFPFLMFQVGNGDVVKGMQGTAASVDRVVLIPQANKKSSADFYAKNARPLGHYTAASMKRIGQRFFEAYQKSYANVGLGHKEGDE
jgi:hypothetical protein